MRKPKRVMLIGAAVATCAATAVVVQPAYAATTTPNAITCSPPAPTTPLAIDGSSTRSTTFGQQTPVEGTAGQQDQITLYFHKAFVSGYVPRPPFTSNCDGTWGTSYVADDDYRIYAKTADAQTAPILVQIAPTISGPVSQAVKKGSTYTIRGTGTPGNTLSIHFHKAGTAPLDYSIVRSVTVDSDGKWTRSYVASVDYRFFATLPNGQRSPSVLVQAR